ncbi:glycoside hydrolase family 2 protein [Streptomyces sp. NBC_01089]|uniref:glycoside hydrolase family 2 protein n=1 Tax=Streptomyces sp. NBC_01089 TaxID=2903747 RepID=UPI0038654CC5|nr:glycoside hydrolase family 2 [Streptomyces sp. NBC_01089]
MRASEQEGTYPRPLMCREQWHSLDGTWDFGYDDADAGERESWFSGHSGGGFDREITVPFPPESPASGIGETAPHPIVWYRRRIAHETLVPAAGGASAPGAEPTSGPVSAPLAVPACGGRTLIHFGAVDHRARVWLDGRLVAEHTGGQTPFTADVTDAMEAGAAEHVLVVRAEDDPADLSVPRGKQDWQERPHAVWYERTTGIWQSVWTETVPAQHITDLAWIPDPQYGVVAEIALARPLLRPLTVDIVLSVGDRVLAETSTVTTGRRTRIDIAIAALRNGIDREALWWSPDSPTLVDARVTVRDPGASGTTAPGTAEAVDVVDVVDSYLGLRGAGVGGGAFLLNDRPYYVRSVLNQGYRPRTLLASSGTAELRREVELIKEMGFNAVRIHQKAEDPRFLYWADRLGLLVWGETGAAYEYGTEAVELLTREWLDLVRRDRSHPSIVTWVPVNESWGLSDVAHDPAQQQYSVALAALTRAVDPTRPVLSNEGWEHTDSDILGVHDYTSDAALLRERYGDAAGFAAVLAGGGPQGRVISLSERQNERFAAGAAPLMITEFGGLSLAGGDNDFFYTQTSSDTQYAELLGTLFGELRRSPLVAGFCYTQFMDTAQETNGLLFPDGTPKLPLGTIRRIVTGVEASD